MIRSLTNVNLLFYHNSSPVSKQFVRSLKKYPKLYDSFVTISMHTRDPQIINPGLPRTIKQLIIKDPSHIPIIGISGLASVITGPKTLEWLNHAIEGEEWESSAWSKDRFGCSAAPVDPDGNIVGLLLSEYEQGLTDIGPDPSAKYSRVDEPQEQIPAFQSNGKVGRVNLDAIHRERESETSRMVSCDDRGMPLRSATAGPALPDIGPIPDMPAGRNGGPIAPPEPGMHRSPLDATHSPMIPTMTRQPTQPQSHPHGASSLVDSAFERLKKERIGNVSGAPQQPVMPGAGMRTRLARSENPQFGNPSGRGSGMQAPPQQQPDDLIPASDAMYDTYGAI